MKFAFDEFHLWYQLALSMVACGKVRFKPKDLKGMFSSGRVYLAYLFE